ncbi:PH domain-containing protein [Bacillus thuringiensis]|uniref:PH domain-containing protein n=1 Tax=Bacillus thuringiensis TaxID=1428 RepID=UPI0021D66F10|nr:PH domain-containing protein [Bacillus thuringiensis]MCU7667781.1 PH domain-containing protein [Bacillus thuringiensis]
MFGKAASDLLGLSDIGSVVSKRDYDKVDVDDYILHEDGEKIYFVIKSKTDEYCFTNKALIHLDGNSALSKKRTLYRYNYATHRISHPRIETAGTIDLDLELKFAIGSAEFSIDVHKKFIEEIKDIYKALIKIEEIIYDNEASLHNSRKSADLAISGLGHIMNNDKNIVENFKSLNETAFDWLMTTKKQYVVKDFGFVFEKYINN